MNEKSFSPPLWSPQFGCRWSRDREEKELRNMSESSHQQVILVFISQINTDEKFSLYSCRIFYFRETQVRLFYKGSFTSKVNDVVEGIGMLVQDNLGLYNFNIVFV